MIEQDLKTTRINQVAKLLYDTYCREVGGKAFNGDPLPDWDTFRTDPAKKKQSDAWLTAAKTLGLDETAPMSRELCYAIEELPASPQQTALSVRASEISNRLYALVQPGSASDQKLAQQDVFIPVSERLPEPCVPVIGYSARWVDEDFNPQGLRECFRTDEGTWISAKWNNYQDIYDTDEGLGPESWMTYPVPK